MRVIKPKYFRDVSEDTTGFVVYLPEGPSWCHLMIL